MVEPMQQAFKPATAIAYQITRSARSAAIAAAS
jgi:hypothetical protein